MAVWNRAPVISVISAPATEPVTTAEAKLFLRVDHSSDDALIASQIAAAREWIETYTGRALITQTLDQRFAGLPYGDLSLVLARPVVQSVTYVKYYDVDGVEQTLSSAEYLLRTTAGPRAGRAVLCATDDATGPSLSSYVIWPVTVRTVCGYGAASAVPDGIKAALYLMLGDMYEQRQETADGTKGRSALTIERLLNPYRVREAV